MRSAARVLLLGGAFAAATWVFGWWSVCAVAAVWPWIAPNRERSTLEATAGALVGWSGLLLWTAAVGPLGELLRRAGGIFGAPGWALVAGTLVYGVALAWSAAILSAAVARRAKP